MFLNELKNRMVITSQARTHHEMPTHVLTFSLTMSCYVKLVRGMLSLFQTQNVPTKFTENPNNLKIVLVVVSTHIKESYVSHVYISSLGASA